jgi:hypothetical protein
LSTLRTLRTENMCDEKIRKSQQLIRYKSNACTDLIREIINT